MDLHGLVGGYRNVIVIGLCEFVRTAVATLYIPFWTLFLLDLGASVVDIGLLSLVTAGIILLFQLPVAYLGDAFGKKRIIVLCSACLSVGYLLNSVAPTWLWVLPGALLVAFGNLMNNLAIAAVTDDVPRAQYGRVLSFRLVMRSSPGIVAPTLAGLLIDRVGLVNGVRFTLRIAALAMGATALVWLLVVQTRNRKASERRRESLSQSLRRMAAPLVRYPDLRLITLDEIAHVLVRGFIQTFIPIYVVTILNFSKAAYGLVASIGTAVGLITRFPMGFLIERVGDARVLKFSAAIRPFILPLYTISRRLHEFAFCHAVYMMSEDNLEATAKQIYITKLVKPSEKGIAIASATSLASLCNTVAPSLNAVLWASAGPFPTFYVNAFLFVVIAIPVILKLKRHTTS